MEDLDVDVTDKSDMILNIKKLACAKYEDLLYQLNVGYLSTDYQNILHMIAFILIADKLDNINKIYELLLTC